MSNLHFGVTIVLVSNSFIDLLTEVINEIDCKSILSFI